MKQILKIDLGKWALEIKQRGQTEKGGREYCWRVLRIGCNRARGPEIYGSSEREHEISWVKEKMKRTRKRTDVLWWLSWGGKWLVKTSTGVILWLISTGSQDKRPDQGRPQFPLPTLFLQLFMEDSKAFIPKWKLPQCVRKAPAQRRKQDNITCKTQWLKSSGFQTRTAPAPGCTIETLNHFELLPTKYAAEARYRKTDLRQSGWISSEELPNYPGGFSLSDEWTSECSVSRLRRPNQEHQATASIAEDPSGARAPPPQEGGGPWRGMSADWCWVVRFVGYITQFPLKKKRKGNDAYYNPHLSMSIRLNPCCILK